MKNNKTFRIIIVLLAIVGLAFLGRTFLSTSDGTITVEVRNIENEIIKSKDIDFDKGDKLVDLIDENFDFTYSNSEYGTFVEGIEGIKNASDYSTFISIYVDDKMSEVGLDSIVFDDGTIISFRDMKNTFNG